jgi:predicted dehydrogenase
MGRDGSASWDGEGTSRAAGGNGRVIRAVRPTGAPTPPDRFYGLEGALDEFVAALRTGAMPQGEGHDNLRSLAMCHAAVESSRTGEPVLVSVERPLRRR